VDRETIEALRRVSTDTIAGLLIRMAGMRTRIVQGVRPLSPAHCRFVGPAFTVRCVPVREDFTDRASMANPGNPLHGTYDRIPAGAVLVMDMMRDTRSGGLGDVLASGLRARGVAGLVLDGGIRDGEAIAALGLPVFCGGVAPAPIGRSVMAVDAEVPVGCGEVLVEPGDIVVADADGVAVIPQRLAGEVARRGLEHDEVENWVRARIENGEPMTGLYPPNDAVRAEFRSWRARQTA